MYSACRIYAIIELIYKVFDIIHIILYNDTQYLIDFNYLWCGGEKDKAHD